MYSPSPSFDPGPAPPVVIWYRAYCAGMLLLYVLVAGLGAAFLLLDPSWFAAMEESDRLVMRIEGALFLPLGLMLAGSYAVGIFAPARPWSWALGAGLIGLGMTSCCCLPAAIPLLIAWLKPETKQWFGKGPPPFSAPTPPAGFGGAPGNRFHY